MTFGLKELKHLENLTVLDLSGIPVRGVGLEELKDLKNFTSLNLYGTQITDVGLEWLKDLAQLGSPDLRGTRVTVRGGSPSCRRLSPTARSPADAKRRVMSDCCCGEWECKTLAQLGETAVGSVTLGEVDLSRLAG